MGISSKIKAEIRQKLSVVRNQKIESTDIQYLLNSISALLADSDALNSSCRVENGKNGQKKLTALTREAADLFVSMCRTYGTVTWKLMQDTTKTLDPGQGVYMLSEELPPKLRPIKNMPHTLPKEEPDDLGESNVHS